VHCRYGPRVTDVEAVEIPLAQTVAEGRDALSRQDPLAGYLVQFTRDKKVLSDDDEIFGASAAPIVRITIGDLEEVLPVFADAACETVEQALEEICVRYMLPLDGLFLTLPGNPDALDPRAPFRHLDYGDGEKALVLGGIPLEEYEFEWEGDEGRTRARLPPFLTLTMAVERVVGVARPRAGYAVAGRYVLSGERPLEALAAGRIRLLPAGDIDVTFQPMVGDAVYRALSLTTRTREVLADLGIAIPDAKAFALFSGKTRCRTTE
jgi:hypothetical protein